MSPASPRHGPEFWEHHFQCKYTGSPATPFNSNYSSACTGRERLTRENTEFEAQLTFVSDAVMAFAHAVAALQRAVCGPGHRGLCPALQPVDGERLLGFLRNVSFTGQEIGWSRCAGYFQVFAPGAAMAGAGALVGASRSTSLVSTVAAK